MRIINWSRGYEKIFMLNSVEHEFFFKKNQLFFRLYIAVYLLINVKMPTIYEQKKIRCSAELSMEIFL